MTIQYKGCHLGGDLDKMGAGKIHNEHTLLSIYKFNNRKKNVCTNMSATFWRQLVFLVNSEGEFTIDWDVLVLTVNTVPGGSAVHNRIKTITISDSNQAQVLHSQQSTHLDDIQTNTVLQPTQESFFFSFTPWSYRDALGFGPASTSWTPDGTSRQAARWKLPYLSIVQ